MPAGQPRPLPNQGTFCPRVAVSAAMAAVFGLLWVTTGAMGQVPTPRALPPAQAPMPAATAHHARHRHSAAKVVAPEPLPAVPVAPPPPLNALQQPSVPAVVTVANRELAVRADNASLSQILRQISTQTGMRLDGVSGDERVFGSFGPGAPREVLTALLNGAGYNLVMVGDLPSGAPRELLLSRRAAAGGAPPVANPQPQGNDNEEDTSPDFEEAPSPPSIAPAEPPQGPVGVPPQGRTPQQIFMERQQQQQNVPPPQ